MRNLRLICLTLGLSFLMFQAGTAAPYLSSNESLPEPPPLPPIERIRLEPASLELRDGRDARRVLVWGETSEGGRIDLTASASFSSESSLIEIEAGVIRPRKEGEAEVWVSAGGQKTKLPVKIVDASIPEVRFARDISPVLSGNGCNAGTCHGSAQGKNGFKLSLRGYDPEFDYDSLINDLSGRRFNRVRVEESLMLLKASGEVPHEGGQVMPLGSAGYELMRQWIREGTRYEEAAQGRPARLEVLPKEVNLELPGMSQQMIVLAHYPDGTNRDVTDRSFISSNNDEVARVKNGVVTSVRRGEAAVLIRYEGNYATREVAVMGDRSGFEWVEVPSYNYVDEHVHAKLRKMKILPSELSTDAEFIRRVSLDLTGQPVSPERVREFLAESGPSREKREKLVEELLGSGGYVEFWANKWADLLQCNSENLGQKGVWLYRDWIRRSIEENKPYNRFVRELLAAEGSSFKNPAVNYYRVLREPDKITEDVSQTFLGTRFNCNKCHDHPFERWTQDQYYEFGAYFSEVAIKRGVLGGEEVVYRNYRGGEVAHPKTGNPVEPRAPFGTIKEIDPETSRREVFIDWLTGEENPLFAKSMANRLWSYFFGRGIIEPVDDIRASNPPVNPGLLEALTEDFIRSGFDLKHLMRVICLSRTYQLSFRANRWNEDDSINFSRAQPRRLSAEQLVDALAVATGRRPQFAGLPEGLRAVEVPDGMVAGNDFLALFGRPKRQSACECERSSNLTLAHAMALINGATIGEAVSAPNNRIERIVAREPDDGKVVEEIYLACLNRPPSPEEIAAIDFSAGVSRLEVAQDLAWALLNSPAFLFNR